MRFSIVFLQLHTFFVMSTEISTGGRLRQWRRSLGLSQYELAGQLGVDVTTVRKYESGATLPNASALTKACTMGLDINWLLIGKGLMLQVDVYPRYAPEAAPYVSAVTDALLALSMVDGQKFTLLAKGFAARSEEALKLAQLEHREQQRLQASRFLGDDGGA